MLQFHWTYLQFLGKCHISKHLMDFKTHLSCYCYKENNVRFEITEPISNQWQSRQPVFELWHDQGLLSSMLSSYQHLVAPVILSGECQDVPPLEIKWWEHKTVHWFPSRANVTDVFKYALAYWGKPTVLPLN